MAIIMPSVIQEPTRFQGKYLDKIGIPEEYLNAFSKQVFQLNFVGGAAMSVLPPDFSTKLRSYIGEVALTYYHVGLAQSAMFSSHYELAVEAMRLGYSQELVGIMRSQIEHFPSSSKIIAILTRFFPLVRLANGDLMVPDLMQADDLKAQIVALAARLADLQFNALAHNVLKKCAVPTVLQTDATHFGLLAAESDDGIISGYDSPGASELTALGFPSMWGGFNTEFDDKLPNLALLYPKTIIYETTVKANLETQAMADASLVGGNIRPPGRNSERDVEGPGVNIGFRGPTGTSNISGMSDSTEGEQTSKSHVKQTKTKQRR